MSDVEARRLRVGDTFPDIDTLKLRIAEEAYLRGIRFGPGFLRFTCVGICLGVLNPVFQLRGGWVCSHLLPKT